MGPNRALLQNLSLEQLLQTVPSGLFLVDKTQRVTYWNSEAERITGYSAAEAVGRHCSFLQGIQCGDRCGLFDEQIPKPLIGISCDVIGRNGRRLHLVKNLDLLYDAEGRMVGGVESFIDITRRKKLEQRLRQHAEDLEAKVEARTTEVEAERQRLATVLNSMTDFAYIASLDFRVTFMNRAMLEEFGDRTGNRCWTMFHEAPGVCPECPMLRVTRGATVREERFLAQNDRSYEIVHTPLSGTDGRPEKLAVFRDITERKEAERELLLVKNRLEHLLVSNPAVIYTCKPTDEFVTTYVSPNVREQLGYRPEDFTATKGFWTQKIHPEDRFRVMGELEEFLQAGRFRLEYRFRHRDAGYRWMLDEGRLIRDHNGHPLEIVGYWIDITERKKAEEKLRETNRELDAFAYTISHDLRTPLTPIIGFAEFLRETYGERLDQAGNEALKEIETQGNRMLALLEDLLSLARIGRVDPPAEPVDLEDLVERTLKSYQEVIGQKNLRVTVDPLPRLALPETLLAQVFDNLLGNAIRYAGGPEAPIEVGGDRDGERVRLWVRDHGSGIPAAERERIFELFYRGPTAKQSRGTGLGLAIVRKIAQLYGGSIRVEETPGGGSTFVLELPAHLAAAPASG